MDPFEKLRHGLREKGGKAIFGGHGETHIHIHLPGSKSTDSEPPEEGSPQEEALESPAEEHEEPSALMDLFERRPKKK
ncbi:MAG: hypothetical protein ACYC9X_00700 [Dehalococcoidia bacterium]